MSRRRAAALGAGALLAGAVAAAAGFAPPGENGTAHRAQTAPVAAVAMAESAARGPGPVPRPAGPERRRPLAGVRIALDPGHQLGNRNFPRQIGRLVPAGGFRKACNTTGTATIAGYPEASLNFAVARRTAARLRSLGAVVRLTRATNSDRDWGPCVNTRGRFGQRMSADLAVSLHADGAAAGARGFHVIAPSRRRPWTSDIAAASLRLARSLRSGLDRRGLPRANYLAAGTALMLRGDLGTLNLSDVPIALVELGNMRNPADARRMGSATGRDRYAGAVVRGIRIYLDR